MKHRGQMHRKHSGTASSVSRMFQGGIIQVPKFKKMAHSPKYEKLMTILIFGNKLIGNHPGTQQISFFLVWRGKDVGVPYHSLDK